MQTFVKRHRAASVDDYESWDRGGVSPTLNAMDNTSDSFATVLAVGAPGDPSYTLKATTPPAAVGVMGQVAHSLTSEGGDASEDGTGRDTPVVATRYIVRRLTPLECERLQGYPDGWTDVLVPKGKVRIKHVPQSDSQKYRQLGNSVTTHVFHWVGVLLVDADARTAR